MLVVLSTVQFMYLYRTISLMSRILFKLYFELSAEVLNRNMQYFEYFIYLKDWLLVLENSTGKNYSNYADLGTLNELKILSLSFQ